MNMPISALAVQNPGALIEQRPSDSTLPAWVADARSLIRVLESGDLTEDRHHEVLSAITLLEEGCVFELQRNADADESEHEKSLPDDMNGTITMLSAVKYYVTVAFPSGATRNDAKLAIAADLLRNIADEVAKVNDSLNMKHRLRTISGGSEIRIHLPTTREDEDENHV